jgi:Cu-processing system permease protein
MNFFRSTLTIAQSTLRGLIRDRVFYAIVLFSVLFTLFSFLLASLTLTENRKVLVDFGLTAISMSGIAMGLFVGLVAIGKEIESKTIYTVLSKPISRLEFMLGKFLGCLLAIILGHLIFSLGLWTVLGALGEGFPQGLIACFYLMILESVFVLALAMFLSTSVSSSFLAGSITVAIFLMGRSSNTFRVIEQKSDSPLIKNAMRILYDLVPNLGRFNIREVVAYAKPYPEQMLFWSTLYWVSYLIFILGLTALVLRKKDFN